MTTGAREVKQEIVTAASSKAIKDLRASIAPTMSKAGLSNDLAMKKTADILDRVLDDLESAVETTNWQREGLRELQRMIRDERELAQSFLSDYFGFVEKQNQPKAMTESQKHVRAFTDEFNDIALGNVRRELMGMPEQERWTQFEAANRAVDAELASYELAVGQKLKKQM